MTSNQRAYARMMALYANGSEMAKREAQAALKRAQRAGEKWCR